MKVNPSLRTRRHLFLSLGLPGCAIPSLALSCLIAGCGGGGSGSQTVSSAPPSGPAATLIAVGSAQTIGNGQVLPVTVSIASSGATAPAGTVVLTSGSYASLPASLVNAQAKINIPAGLLPLGANTLTAAFTSAAPQTYSNGSGTETVTITASSMTPTVTATSVSYPTAGRPFRALQTAAGDVLVSETDPASVYSGVQVFHRTSTGLQNGCINLLRSNFLAQGAGILGTNLFNKGANVAAAVGNQGVLFFSTAAFPNCTAQGTQVSQGSVASGQGSFDVTVTPDGKYAFVANEYGMAAGSSTPGNIGVVALQYDASGNVTTASTLIGQIATGGNTIAGVLLSPDATRLYVTSEVNVNANAAGGSNPVLARTGCLQAAGGTPSVNGLLSVIDVAKAEASPSPAAILATVAAGCSPVRMVETSNEGVLWVAARGDNRVLAFNPGMLELNAGNALLAYADTGGVAPVGMTLFYGEELLAVANSSRFTPNAYGNLAILSAAVPSTAHVLQTVPAGMFPREVTVGTDDSTLFLTNYLSNSLQVVSPSVF